MTEAMVRVDSLSRHFGLTRAVDDVSFEIRTGETLALVGESGSGKTTLGRLLLRLIEPTSGSITYNMACGRRETQIIFQDPYTSLDPKMKIGDIVSEPLVVHGIKRDVSGLLELVELPAGFADRYPHELSGGERQRVGIARALATDPAFIVADEPVSSLDVTVQARILKLMLGLKTKFNLTMLFISHDLMVVQNLADRVLVMKSGKIVEEGPGRDIFTRPSNSYTRLLLESTPRVPVI